MLSHAKLLLPLLALSFGISLCFAAPSDDPQKDLQPLLDRQKELFAAAEKDDPNFDQDNFRIQLQQLSNDYDKVLRDHPDFAAGYAAYGLLLGKIDMRKESAAMLLQANRLDKNMPLVKNQLGNYLAEEGKPLDAVNYFLSAIQLAPKEALYHYQLGTLLTEARDDFLQSGNWTREGLDKAMHEAFRQATSLEPTNVAFAYRYGESFYDVEHPDWDQALQYWRELELKVSSSVEKQTVRLHEANVLMKQQKFDEARRLIESVTESVLEKQKQKLLEQFPKSSTP